MSTAVRNEVWYCETCGAVSSRNDKTHYRYGPHKPSQHGGSGETAWATVSSRDLVLCGPMKRGRWVADDSEPKD